MINRGLNETLAVPKLLNLFKNFPPDEAIFLENRYKCLKLDWQYKLIFTLHIFFNNSHMSYVDVTDVALIFHYRFAQLSKF